MAPDTTTQSLGIYRELLGVHCMAYEYQILLYNRTPEGSIAHEEACRAAWKELDIIEGLLLTCAALEEYEI